MITVKDVAGTDGQVTVEKKSDICDAIKGWFDLTPEVVKSLVLLEKALNNGDPTEAMENHLGITIEY